jgi:hypothetical protein
VKKNKKKDFSILKWIVFPANSLVLAGVITYFNLTVFGWEDGLPYSIIVAMIGLFSIVINKYTESENRSLARATFVFEIFLTVALVINAAYSISVQRKMSVAKMGETSQAQTIEQISKLRGSRTQREALTKIDKKESAQSVFGEYEAVLFWIMVGELALYGLTAFTLFALAKLVEDEESKTETTAAKRGERSKDTEEEFPADFPDELDEDVSVRGGSKEPRLTSPTIQRKNNDTVSQNLNDTGARKRTTQTTTQDASAEGLKRLRAALKLIAFHHPGTHFKADRKEDCVWIRAMRSEHGEQRTIASTSAALGILDDAVKMSPDALRTRLEKFLKSKGFPLNSATG